MHARRVPQATPQATPQAMPQASNSLDPNVDYDQPANKRQATPQATLQATPNDTSDDQENLDLLVKHNYISQANADSIQDWARKKKIPLGQAYKKWMSVQSPGTG